MKQIINKGQVLALMMYAFYGIAIILGAVLDKSGFSVVSVITFIYWAITLVAMCIIRMSALRNSAVYDVLCIVSAGILAVFLQLCFTSIFIVFVVDAILWLTIITFLDKRYFHLAVIIQALSLVFLVVTPRDFSGLKDFNITSLIFSIVGLFLADRVGCGIIDILHKMGEENQEHERSLDDMLEIVESKHNKARQLSAARQNFLSTMSHELRTPLNAIIGFNEMIIRKTNDEEILEYANDVKSSGTMMLSLVNDILDLSKIESNKMTLVTVDFNINDLVNDISNMIEPKVKGKGLEYIVKVDPEVVGYYHGDDIRLKQILVNLINNAVKYTAAGSVTFAVSGMVSDEEGYIRFSVKDTGVGIKEEDLSKLNQKFVRIDEEKNRNIEGTGLGITIVSNLLKLMGSQLVVESTYGEGSEFSFSLCLPIVNGSNAGESGNQIGDGIEEFIAEDMEILVVDDTPLNLKVTEALLKKTKVKVYTADSGMKAIEMAKEKKYDAILLDRMMPEMDGVETLHNMRAIENFVNAETPIIALTADVMEDAKSTYLKWGFDDYLSKPVVPKDLEHMLSKYWKK